MTNVRTTGVFVTCLTMLAAGALRASATDATETAESQAPG